MRLTDKGLVSDVNPVWRVGPVRCRCLAVWEFLPGGFWGCPGCGETRSGQVLVTCASARGEMRQEFAFALPEAARLAVAEVVFREERFHRHNGEWRKARAHPAKNQEWAHLAQGLIRSGHDLVRLSVRLPHRPERADPGDSFAFFTELVIGDSRNRHGWPFRLTFDRSLGEVAFLKEEDPDVPSALSFAVSVCDTSAPGMGQ